MAKSLVQLKKLVVEECEMMEEIITKGDGYIEGGSKVKILFPKLEKLKLLDLPKLECVCSGYYNYDIPLFTVEQDKEFNNNDNKIQILFPELKTLVFQEVPKLKCFCSGVYNYDIMEECSNMTTFLYGNVIVNTPNLHTLDWDQICTMRTLGDLNLTIYYAQNSKKYMVDLKKLETFRDVGEELLGYIKRETWLRISNCHKLLNYLSMVASLPNLNFIGVSACEKMKEIIGNNFNAINCIQQKAKKITFPSLNSIFLEKLPSLKCFSQSSFPCYVDMLQCLEVDASGRSKQARIEKKSHKAVLKLGMKSINGVIRITPEDEDVDKNGVDPKDIELVVTQAGVPRSRAVKTLKAANGDIVGAIMELTN
ncbi:nascent polypeptide-associated complex subunit alpha protein [Trifolium repens]|nr:nascent polypeptide-associated complex subunit alpha protein [Trifolium repens]